MKKGELEGNYSSANSRPRIKWTGQLVRFWKDLHHDQVWKYEESGPIELLEKAEIDHRTALKDELDRVAWFWRRRPRALLVVGLVSWLTAAVAAPFCVIAPGFGVPLLILSIALLLLVIVRSVRWRREYELSIDRLIRTSGNGSAAFDCHVVP